MTALSKRSTFYLDPALLQAIRLKSVESFRSLSEIVNSILKEATVEDIEELKAFSKSAGNPLVRHQEMIRKLKKMAEYVEYRVFFKKPVWKDIKIIPDKDFSRILSIPNLC